MTQEAPSFGREVFAGLVERVTFHNAENGLFVLRAPQHIGTVVEMAEPLAVMGPTTGARASFVDPRVASSSHSAEMGYTDGIFAPYMRCDYDFVCSFSITDLVITRLRHLIALCRSPPVR
jgi:hypothetical protein